MSQKHFIVIVFGALLLCQLVFMFNLDTNSSVFVEGPSGSIFGFSVAMWWKDSIPKLAIGAPGYGNSKVPSAMGKGAVFLCDLEGRNTTEETCEQLPRDYSMTPAQSVKRYLSELGFGFSIATGQDIDSPLLACAPQSYYNFWLGLERSYKTIGKCELLFSTSNQGVTIQQDEQGDDNINDFIYCGFSATFSKDGSAVQISCPSISVDESQFQTLTYNMTTQTLLTRNQTAECHGNFYRGWDIAPKNEGDEFIASCLRLNETSKIVESHTGSDESYVYMFETVDSGIGERVGYSVDSCDIDGDGEDEVVVGVPFGRVPDDDAGWRETGKVFVIKGKERDVELSGIQEFSRFGTSVVCLGDLNMDGYEDIAIGAPQHYGGGAVFIFTGSSQGIQKEPSQIIHGLDVTRSQNIAGFGYSLAGGKDLDDNGYPDLLVGSPQANAAVFIRSAPVVKLRISSFEFTKTHVDLSEDDRTLELMIKVEMKSTESIVVDLSFQLNLDESSAKRKRIFFVGEKSRLEHKVKISSSSEVFTYKAYVDDIATEAEIKDVSYATLEANFLGYEELPDDALRPVLEDLDRQGTVWTGHKGEASVTLICNTNNTSCIAMTNVILGADAKRSPFEVGPQDLDVDFTLKVENATAFDPWLVIREGQGLRLKQVCYGDNLLCLECKRNYTCSPEGGDCVGFQKCKSSRQKLRPGDKASITMTFRQDREEILRLTNSASNPHINVTVEAHVLNEDLDLSDSSLTVTLLPEVMPDLHVLGFSEPETVRFQLSTTSDYDGVKNGSRKSTTHYYNWTRKGDIPLKEIQVDIFWPVTNKTDNETLLTIPVLPELSNRKAGSCSVTRVPGNDSSLPDICKTVFFCSAFRCMIKPESSDKRLGITTEALINQSYFKTTNSFEIRSYIHARVTDPKGWIFNTLGDSLERNDRIRQSSIATHVSVIQKKRNDSPPIWVILLSVVGGLSLLGLLAFGLYKVGFFKRKIIPKSQQQQQQKEELGKKISDSDGTEEECQNIVQKEEEFTKNFEG